MNSDAKIMSKEEMNKRITDAFVKRGNKYANVEDYEELKKYLHVLLTGDSDESLFDEEMWTRAMEWCGWYYKRIENNPKLAKKYWVKAADKGSVDAMMNLADLYYIDPEDCNNQIAEKYWLMAMEKGCGDAIDNLVTLYILYECNKKLLRLWVTHQKCILRLNMGSFYIKEFINAISKLLNDQNLYSEILELFAKVDLSVMYDVPPWIRLCHTLLTNQIDIIDLHSRYAPGADGAKEAKRDYINLIKRIT